MRIPTLLIAFVLAAAGVLPGVAVASSASDRIIRDCETSSTGLLTGHYTKAQLRQALNSMQGDVSEYSGCADAIRQALLASETHHGAGGGGSGPGGGGGSTAPGGGSGTNGRGGSAFGGSASDPIAHIASPSGAPHVGSQAPVQLAGKAIEPGTVPALGHGGHTLPTPLIVFLVLLAGGALVATATTIGRRVVTRCGA
jgi:hypothetical protein